MTGVQTCALPICIMAAKDAGAYCIAYDNPNSGPQDLSRADKIVSSLSDIVVSDILQN